MIKTAHHDHDGAADDDDDEGRSAYCRLMRIADTGSQSVAHENQDDDEDDDEVKG